MNDGSQKSADGPAVDRTRKGQFSNLRRRIYLTYQYRGPWSVLYRALTFPLRFTPLKPVLRLEGRPRGDRKAAMRWYRKHGQPVTVVIPSYRDAERVAALVASIGRTTDHRRVQILVPDDNSGPEHIAALRTITGIRCDRGRGKRWLRSQRQPWPARADPPTMWCS